MWARANAAYSPSRAERRIESEADDKFSKEEAHQVRVALLEFRARVEAEFHPSCEQADAISSHLDYLSEAVGRLSKFDWRAVAVKACSTLTSRFCSLITPRTRPPNGTPQAQWRKVTSAPTSTPRHSRQVSELYPNYPGRHPEHTEDQFPDCTFSGRRSPGFSERQANPRRHTKAQQHKRDRRRGRLEPERPNHIILQARGLRAGPGRGGPIQVQRQPGPAPRLRNEPGREAAIACGFSSLRQQRMSDRRAVRHHRSTHGPDLPGSTIFLPPSCRSHCGGSPSAFVPRIPGLWSRAPR
jgi:hypothetical protein